MGLVVQDNTEMDFCREVDSSLCILTIAASDYSSGDDSVSLRTGDLPTYYVSQASCPLLSNLDLTRTCA